MELLEKTLEKENLNKAYKHVKENHLVAKTDWLKYAINIERLKKEV